MDQTVSEGPRAAPHAPQQPNDETTICVEPSTCDQELAMDGVSDAEVDDAMSPGSKRVLAMCESVRKKPVEHEPASTSMKFVKRPVSSGDDAPVQEQYQMKAASFRAPILERPVESKVHVHHTSHAEVSSAEEQQASSQGEPFAVKVNIQAVDLHPTKVPEVPLFLSNHDRPVARGTQLNISCTEKAAVSPTGADGLTEKTRAVSSQKPRNSANVEILPKAKTQQKSRSRYAPPNMTLNEPDTVTQTRDKILKEVVGTPARSDEITFKPSDSERNKIEVAYPDTVLPSIDGLGIDADETLVEQAIGPALHRQDTTSTAYSHTRATASAKHARPDRPNVVLHGRIAKKPTPMARSQVRPPQVQAHPEHAGHSTPSEEDLLFLLMHRNRRIKERELELAASQKQLQVQNDQLHQQTWTHRQQLADATVQQGHQQEEINRSKAEIKNFKIIFTKFKEYAKQLAQDHVDLGKSMKAIQSKQIELTSDKNHVLGGFGMLKQASADSEQKYKGLVSEIKSIANRVGPLENDLRVAQENMRINDASLQHERSHNNRIESNFLQNQQAQLRSRQNLMQEYRSATAYLDELCRAVLQLGKIATKTAQSKETPGVKQCLSLLQALKEAQCTGLTTLEETKTVVSAMSERLLTYQTTTEEATETAARHNEQLSDHILAQLTTSLDAFEPSIATEVNFATLQERTKNMQAMLTMGHQALNSAYDGKTTSEQREQQQSRRVDKLLDQLAEASRRPEPRAEKAPPPTPGPDFNVMQVKLVQANSRYAEEQGRVVQKDGELHQKGLEIRDLKDKLDNVEAARELLQSSFSKLEKSHYTLQNEVDFLQQNNISLQGQVNNNHDMSIKAAKMSGLICDLTSTIADLQTAQLEADKVPELEQQPAAKDVDLDTLRLLVAKLSALTTKITSQDTQLRSQRIEATELAMLKEKLITRDTEVSSLAQTLSNRDAELEHLGSKVSEATNLTETLALCEAEIAMLRPQLTARASHNMTLQLDVNRYKASIQTLEEEVFVLEAQIKGLTELQKENVALKATATQSQTVMQGLKGDITKAQARAQKANALQDQLAKLTVDWGDHDQIKTDLELQKEVHAKQTSQIIELQSNLEDARITAGEVPALREEVHHLSAKSSKLDHEISDTKRVAQDYDLLKSTCHQKDEDISALRIELQNLKALPGQLEEARKEGRFQNERIGDLQEHITKLQVDLEKLPGRQESEALVVEEEEFPTQQTMLDLRDILDQQEQFAPNNPAATLHTHHFSDTRPEIPYLKQSLLLDDDDGGIGTQKTRTENVETRAPKRFFSNLDDTQQIPDSQPDTTTVQANGQNLSATSSPLSSLESPVTHSCHRATEPRDRQTQLPNSRPPSSSYGGDAMLLEDFEGMENTSRDSQSDGAELHPKMAHLQRSSQRQHGYGHGSSRTIVTKNGTEPGSHCLRSTLTSQIISETQSQPSEAFSPHILPSSPAGPAKHLPNSAAKRPRLDPIESTSSIQTNSKRLKRTPANLDIRKTPKRPESSNTQLTEPETTHQGGVSLPSGGRKGSVIGANAPSPGKARGSKRQTRKGRRSERYAERFDQN